MSELEHHPAAPEVPGVRLDLGSGHKPREGFVGVDIARLDGITTFDLTSGDKWPWKDGSVDALSSSHFIEHIAADYVEVARARSRAKELDSSKAEKLVELVKQDRLLFFFDEAFRVIKPGGLFHLSWPALQSTDAFRDPTHRRFIPLEMLYYLSAESRAQMGLEHYEARCNWLIDADVNLTGDASDEMPLAKHRHFWNVQREWRVTLRAEK